MKLVLSTLFFSILLLTSCTEKFALITASNCQRTLSYFKLKKTTDFKKHFTIQYPNTWKTKLYYDNFQSEIMVADTLKSLKETFIYDASWNFGEIEINTAFQKAMDDKVFLEDSLTISKSGMNTLKKKPLYWHLSEGKKNNRTYQVFKAYVKTGVDTYLMVSADIYGKENQDTRLCQILEILETTEFL